MGDITHYVSKGLACDLVREETQCKRKEQNHKSCRRIKRELTAKVRGGRRNREVPTIGNTMRALHTSPHKLAVLVGKKKHVPGSVG